MKTIFITTLTACLVSFAYGQIQVIDIPDEIAVGKVKAGFKTLATLTYHLTSSSDTIYKVNYKNMGYPHDENDYQSFSFSSTKGEINELYNVLKSFFAPNPKKQLIIKIGQDDLYLKGMKSNGTPYVSIMVKSSLLNLTEKQIDKLFGK